MPIQRVIRISNWIIAQSKTFEAKWERTERTAAVCKLWEPHFLAFFESIGWYTYLVRIGSFHGDHWWPLYVVVIWLRAMWAENCLSSKLSANLMAFVGCLQLQLPHKEGRFEKTIYRFKGLPVHLLVILEYFPSKASNIGKKGKKALWKVRFLLTSCAAELGCTKQNCAWEGGCGCRSWVYIYIYIWCSYFGSPSWKGWKTTLRKDNQAQSRVVVSWDRRTSKTWFQNTDDPRDMFLHFSSHFSDSQGLPSSPIGGTHGHADADR